MSIQPTSPTSMPQSPTLPPHLSLLSGSNSNTQKTQSQSQLQPQSSQSTQPSQLQLQAQSTQIPSSLSSNQLPNSVPPNLTTSLISTSTSQIPGNLVNSLPPLSSSNCNLNQNSANNPNSNQIPPPSRPTKLTYNIFDRSARKIATLVKIANLPYQIEQNHETNGQIVHVLSTPFGNLHKQYQIIYYLINQSKLLSKPPQSPSNPPSEPQLPIPPQSSQPLEQSQLPQKALVPPLPASPYSLQPPDPYLSSKMHEKLYELRITLFPLLHEFYKYMTGFQKTKKSKYDSLMTKIKKYIEELDSQINEHPEMYHSQFNFLNIIIACEISMACKFVFQEKFRKSKYSLISKYERITNRKEYVEVHGKSDLCQKEYLPSEFEEDGANGDKGADKPNGMSNSGNLASLEKQLHSHVHVNSHTSIPVDIGKIQIGQIGSGVGLSPTNSINFNVNGATSATGNGVGLFDQQISYAAFGNPGNSNRNQLVYYYFKQALMNFANQNLADSRDRDRQIVSSPNLSSMSKKHYFPYFWLMFEDLACTLLQISLSFPEGATSSPSPSLQQTNSSKLKNLQRKLIQQTDKQIDYGFVALYQKQGKFSIRGVLCLGSKTLEEMENSLNKEKDGKEKEKQKGQGFLFVSGSSAIGQGKDNINLCLNGVANSSPCVVKLHKIDANLEKQRKQIEKIWENTSQGAIVDDLNLVGLLSI